MGRKLTNEEFIAKAILIHGNRYGYDNVEYKGSHNKIMILCKKHGLFEQEPNSHLQGRNCPICGKKVSMDKNKSNNEEFIAKAKFKHHNKYDYSQVEYINSMSKVNIICKTHGEFKQTPNHHLKGVGCPICASNAKLNNKDFIVKAKLIHGDKYDYSKIQYINSNTKIMIHCKKHGMFSQTPSSHLSGNGCPLCGGTAKSNKENFVFKAKLVHGDKYDYSQVEYINAITKTNINCPDHGVFKQKPNDHLNGDGCPICNESKLERNMRKYLNENNIPFEYQKRFPWLGKLSLDFYLPELNIGIECQGEQHFKPVNFSGKGKQWADKEFGRIKERDIVKKELCLKHGIKILYYNYDDLKNPLDEKVR